MPPKPRAASQPDAVSSALASPHLFLGTSGWAYPTWKPGFYPQDLASKRFLEFYASRFNSVEVNYTYSAELKPGQLEGWLAAVPAGFRFTFKAPQRITHFNRLLNSEPVLNAFLSSLAPAAQAAKLGAILFQLPHNFKPDHQRLATFLAAPALRDHQVVFEFLHPGWFSEETYALLRAHNVALSINEGDKVATLDVQTAPHRYYRLRKPGGYKLAQLKLFAQQFTAPSADIYAYFRHEDEPTGALNATATLKLIAKANKAATA